MGWIVNQFIKGKFENGFSEKSQVYPADLAFGENAGYFCQDITNISGKDNTPCDACTILDAIRRNIIRILNELDSPAKERNGKRETLCERLTRLSNEGKMPKTVVVLIRLINSYRNLAVYEDYKINIGHLALAEEAWILVRDWWDDPEKEKNGT